MTEVGNAYGEALYDLAKSENLSDEIFGQITVLDECFQQEPSFLRLLQSAALTKPEKCEILESSFRGKLHGYVLNFLKILAEKNYVRHFEHCVAAYRRHYNLDNDILPVSAVTAVSLTETQAEKLSEKLHALTGKKIELRNRVEPGILGGVRLDYDGQRLDNTVSHRLEAIGTMLRSTVL